MYGGGFNRFSFVSRFDRNPPAAGVNGRKSVHLLRDAQVLPLLNCLDILQNLRIAQFKFGVFAAIMFIGGAYVLARLGHARINAIADTILARLAGKTVDRRFHRRRLIFLNFEF